MKGDPSKPLHQCNFYGSFEAGNKLKEMLRLGGSKPWKEQMALMTGEPRMNTDALREYFKPLEDWLKQENARNGVTVGWNHDDNNILCHDSPSNDNVPKPVIDGKSIFLFSFLTTHYQTFIQDLGIY